MYLTKLQQDALMEFKDGNFPVPWRPKTMQSLVNVGLTREVVFHKSPRPHYVLTDEGMKVLKDILSYEYNRTQAL